MCVTEIAVRLDCNGCVQKVKRALKGLSDNIAIDVAQNKLTLTGVATVETITKAMKKIKKPITVISRTTTVAAEPAEPVPPPEPEKMAAPPEPEQTAAPPEPEKTAAPPEPEKTAAPPEPEKTVPPPPEKKEPSSEEAQMVHHYPHHDLRRDNWPQTVIYSYNRRGPVGGVVEYVQLQPLEQSSRFFNSYQPQESHGERQIGFYHPHQTPVTTMFSDENPNSCNVM